MAKFAKTPRSRAMQALESVLIPRHVSMEHVRYSIEQTRAGIRAPLVGILTREYSITAADLAEAFDALLAGDVAT